MSTDVGTQSSIELGLLFSPFLGIRTQRGQNTCSGTHSWWGQDPPAPHCSSSPRVRDSTALSSALGPKPGFLHVTLSLGHSCWVRMVLTHPHGGAAGPAPCVGPASQGCLWVLRQAPPGICSSRRIVSLGQRLSPLLGCWAALGWLEQDLPWLICHWWGLCDGR